MKKKKYLRIANGFTLFARLLGLVGDGVVTGDSTTLSKGVIVGDKS